MLAIAREKNLTLAARTGDLQSCIQLLGQGVDIETTSTYSTEDKYGSHGYTALHWAVQYTRFPIVKELLNRGANVGARTNTGFTALLLELQKESPSIRIVRLLIQKNADPSEYRNSGGSYWYGYNAFHMALYGKEKGPHLIDILCESNHPLCDIG